MIGFVGVISSCSNDNDVNPPVITFPSTGIPPEIVVGEGFDFTFTVIANGGYDNHALTAKGGTIVENSSIPGAGETEFTISGTFTAGDVTGPGGITLTVHDEHGFTSHETLEVEIVK